MARVEVFIEMARPSIPVRVPEKRETPEYPNLPRVIPRTTDPVTVPVEPVRVPKEPVPVG